MFRLILCSLLGCLAGCSLVYDFGRFEGGAGQDAAPDVNPADLALREVLSTPLLEGSGCLPVAEPVVQQAAGEGTVTACAAGSPTVAVLIEGENIVPDAAVTLTGLGFSSDQVESIVSSDGTLIAFEIAVPVDTSLGEGETSTLSVTVSQDGAEPQSIDVPVGHVDELVASSFADPVDAVAALASGRLFSTITIDAELDLIGASPFHLRATSLISIQQPLLARGGINGARRAGGCSGGAAASAGGCGQQGGGAGSGDGGGGGGNQDEGGDGSGGSQNGGAPTPNGFLVPLADHTGRGGGGANGVTGGDGGGLIALTSSGRIEIAAGIDVGGGDGESSDGGLACNLVGGPGGGGGAGGSILVRARESIVLAETGSMTLGGGPGGTGTDPNCNGGDGSVGRVRVDAPTLTGALADVIVEPEVNPVKGAIIAPQSLVRTGPAEQVIELSGDTANSPVTWISVGDQVDDFNFVTERTVTLAAGVNEVCVHVTDPGQGEPEESRQCVEIVYLP